jgi:hypothetical protein
MRGEVKPLTKEWFKRGFDLIRALSPSDFALQRRDEHN